MIEVTVNPNAQYSVGGYTVTHTAMDEAQDYNVWVRAVDNSNEGIPF